jgi:hypothetical protein
VIIESAPYEMNAANAAARQIMSYYFGERLDLKKQKEQAESEKNIEEEQLNLENEITSPDGAEPVEDQENEEEMIIPQRIEEEISE